MRRVLLTGLVVVLAALSAAATSLAQPAVPGGRPPAVSPYLNLLRRGGSPTLNYYGLVRPDVQMRQSISGVESVATANQASITDLYTGGGLPQTGVAGQFLNHGGFFLTQGRGGGGAPMAGGGGGGGRSGTGAAPRR